VKLHFLASVDKFPIVGLVRLELGLDLVVVTFVGIARSTGSYSVFKGGLAAVTRRQHVVKSTTALF
jgi:hypothetical protein